MLLISFIKYAWVAPLENKKGITISDILQNFLNESRRKTNKIQGYKSGKLHGYYIEMHSIHIEGKPAADERFIIRTLKNKICKDMASISKMLILINWVT